MFKRVFLTIILLLTFTQYSKADVLTTEMMVYPPTVNLFLFALCICILSGVSLLILYTIKALNNKHKDKLSVERAIEPDTAEE